MSKPKRKTGGGRRRQVRGGDAPVRSCVGCRRAAPKDELLRFVRAPDGAVVFDVTAKMDTRGAYTCAHPECIERASVRGGFKRAFEESVVVSSELSDEVLEIIDHMLLQDLGIARRLGTLIAGRTDTFDAVKKDESIFVGASSDLSDRSRRELEKELSLREVSIRILPDKNAVGRAIGRRATGVVGIRSSRVADRVARNCQRRLRFSERRLQKTKQSGVLRDGEKGRMPQSSSLSRDTEGVH